MILDVYGVYDEATEVFVQFIPCQNEKVARMTFETLFKQKRLNIPMIYDYPNNFKIYRLATYDDVKGLFTNLDHHEMLLDVSSLSTDNI